MRRPSDSVVGLLLAVTVLAACAHAEEKFAQYTLQQTALPQETFSVQPQNVTVVEGAVAVMKCKVKVAVTSCRWFYLETGKDFFDPNENPKKVKQFEPTKNTDCSIRFTSTKKIQEGQWLCQARKYMSTSYYNANPATLRVLTESEEKEYHSRRLAPRDPPAPTAIPAMEPPPPHRPPHGEKMPQFSYSPDDHIQNTNTGRTATLRCKVDQPVTSCGWVMPNNALFVWNEADTSIGRSLSVNTPVVPLSGDSNLQQQQEYEFVGDRGTGNCSLRINSVRHHDEGNWRCVVKVQRSKSGSVPAVLAASQPPPEAEVQGPLIHLHLLDFPHHIHRMPDNTKHSSGGTNYTLIALFLVGLVVFVVGATIIYCCYKKVWSKQEEASKLPQSSPGSTEADYSQQWFQGRNLKIVDPNYTDDFKLRTAAGTTADINLRNIDALNIKNSQHAAIKYSDLDHYNQYINMSQEGPASVRSSASSNTTLSTVLPDPLGRDRSISFGTNSPIGQVAPIGQHIHGHHHGPPQVPFYEIHRNLQRPVSLYSTGHVYEEIQDKVPVVQIPPNHIVNKQGMIVPVTPGSIPHTPVYTNVVEDNDGYLIPSKSAKIVNTPTGEDPPAQYLPMRGDTSGSSKDIPYQPQNVVIPNMNNLSQNAGITRHMQAVANDLANRRLSAESNRSVEENQAVGMSPTATPYTSTPKPDTPSNHTNGKLPGTSRSSLPTTTTPNSKRQKMPLPNPKNITKASSSKQPALHIGAKNSSLAHQRTTSLPDTSNAAQANHAKSPSLVPTPENYDVPKSVAMEVPRTLDAVPRSVNGSEISLDDIDGTIV